MSGVKASFTSPISLWLVTFPFGPFVSLTAGQNTQSIVQAIAAQGFNFANLKYSRNHENEADHIGLIITAMAGYDPQVALPFWQRMAASSTAQTAEFLIDHPSDATRIKNIRFLWEGAEEK